MFISLNFGHKPMLSKIDIHTLKEFYLREGSLIEFNLKGLTDEKTNFDSEYIVYNLGVTRFVFKNFEIYHSN